MNTAAKNKKKKLRVKCPQCKKDFEYNNSKYRPFCSKRCKLIDLGHWLDESYNVSIPINEFDEEIILEGDSSDEKE